MKLFNMFKDKEGKYIKKEIKNTNELPEKIVVKREDGTITKAFDIKVEQTIKHKDDSITYLVSGKVLNNKDSIKSNFICFEVPRGRLDLAENVIENNTGMKLNRNLYTYIGRAFSNEDIRLQPPTCKINNKIEQLNKKIDIKELRNYVKII